MPTVEPATHHDTPAEEHMHEALGPDMAADTVLAAGAVTSPPRSSRRWIVLAVIAIIGLQILGWFAFPPFDPRPDHPTFSYPESAIHANFELPAPHVVLNLSGEELSHDIITFQPTIPNTILSGWIVALVIIILAFLLSRSVTVVPRRGQNALEYVYEGLANFATSVGGPEARRYVPIFATFFIFILLSNWSGLLPFFGRTAELRAATSDVNVTIGLALVAFVVFHVEGVRKLGVRRYLAKFFNFSGFREGIGAGIIALFVGVLEFFLEFVKPVTLSMRLFGNIYAGEVALGVISALTIFAFPVIMLLLEGLLNFMQALIFSVLALMFTLTAIESHDEHDESHPELPEGNIAPELHSGAAHA